MGFWHIGPLKGEFQPEDFTESQETDVEYKTPVGGRQVAVIKGWSPREITISFVVDNLARNESPAPNPSVNSPQASPNDPGSLSPSQRVDPEEVWQAIQRMQRPANGRVSEVKPVPVLIPGWGDEGRNQPRLAFITDSSIQRTHIQGVGTPINAGGGNAGEQNIRAVKATITVTLKEAVRIRRD